MNKIDVPLSREISKLVKKMTLLERVFIGFFSIILVISVSNMLLNISDEFSSDVPLSGGKLTEGIVGFPRFINPLLAISDADRDLSILIYSGLMRARPNGSLIEDLADSYNISEDGLVYTFKIKEDAVFHDGESVTSDDILFTITMAQNNTVKSPKRASWTGITANKIDEKTIEFLLEFPYSPFLENTTIGILPEHIWRNIDLEQFPFSSFNIEPVGSGPYEIQSIKRDSSGISESYTLKSFKEYSLGEPYLSEIEIKFYSNDESLNNAYDSNSIESINRISPSRADEIIQKGGRIETYPLPRIFGVFLNQNQATLFSNKNIRLALDIAIDKERLVEKIFGNYGSVINGPIPLGLSPTKNTSPNKTREERINEATSILEKNGWKMDENKVMSRKGEKLEFTIATSNANELKETAQFLKNEWANIGVKVNLQFFESSNLNQDVIRPRKYEALLFGEIIGRDKDLYAFWHSSQRNDPGLNIVSYTNIDVDRLLEEAREKIDKEILEDTYIKLEQEIKNDMPAIFLYSPDFIYSLPKKIKGIDLGTVTTSSERFLNVYEWYINSEKIWNIFN